MAKCEKCLHYKVCEKNTCSECSVGFGCEECEIYYIYDGKPNIENCKDFTPTADVVEVKHGYWKEVNQIGRGSRHIQYTTKQCSVCGYWNGRKKTKYCPECGAKMDGERMCDNG